MKNYIRILIIVGIVVVAGIAVWVGTNRPPVATISDTVTSPSATPLPSVSPISIAYDSAPKDWKKYSSASMNFSVSYPKDWQFGVCGPKCVAWAPPTAASTQYALGIIEETGSLDDLLKNAEPYLVAKEEVKVGTLTWTKLTLRQTQTGAIVTSHYIAKDGELYQFGTASAEADIISVYGSMIASFKFLK